MWVDEKSIEAELGSENSSSLRRFTLAFATAADGAVGFSKSVDFEPFFVAEPPPPPR